MENIKELHFSYLYIPHSFCPATYSAPIDCSISINVTEPLMDVPHRIFHCNKELYNSAFFVTFITGRQSCIRDAMCREALQIRI